jgi:hypothetical protein
MPASERAQLSSSVEIASVVVSVVWFTSEFEVASGSLDELSVVVAVSLESLVAALE